MLTLLDGDVIDAFDEQISRLTGASGPATMLELHVPADSESTNRPDGPLKGFVAGDDIAVIGENGDTVGGIIVWLEDGRLASLEYYWFTDDPPRELPLDDQIVRQRQPR